MVIYISLFFFFVVLGSLWLWFGILGSTTWATPSALCFTFWGTIVLFSTVASPFYIPITNAWEWQFFHSLPVTFFLLLSQWVWYSILLWFWFTFSKWLMLLTCFPVLISHLSSLEKCLIKFFAHQIQVLEYYRILLNVTLRHFLWAFASNLVYSQGRYEDR
jgi:hypothetical protein